MTGCTTLGELASLTQCRISYKRIGHEHERHETAQRHFAQYAQMTPAQLEKELAAQRWQAAGTRNPKYAAVIACWQEHPDWMHKQIAQTLGVSKAHVCQCVKKWRKAEATCSG